MQNQHSKWNIFNKSYIVLQDYKEVKTSPDFNLINISYKNSVINPEKLIVYLQFPFHDNGIVTLFNGNALSDT